MKPRSVELVYKCTNATEAAAIDAVLTAMPELKAMYAPQGTLTLRIDNVDPDDATATSGTSTKA